jgi:hypothetical protein
MTDLRQILIVSYILVVGRKRKGGVNASSFQYKTLAM